MNALRQRQAVINDEQLFSEKEKRYLGRARIDIKSLQFEIDHTNASQFTNAKVVKKLAQKFALEGCHRLDEEHHVSALISPAVLQVAIQKSGISVGDLRTAGYPQKLEIPQATPLNCLYGRHRLQAAKGILPPEDEWWVTELYSDGWLFLFFLDRI